MPCPFRAGVLLAFACILPAAPLPGASAAASSLPWARAHFVVPPAIFVRHDRPRVFIGPGTFQLPGGDILLLASYGFAPATFEELRGSYPLPHFYRSSDDGRTWRKEGTIAMKWGLTGYINDGGISFLRLRDGRLALVAHRYVPDNKGGGLPIISYSADNGTTWTPAEIVGRRVAPDDGWYVMNDRLIQLSTGRLRRRQRNRGRPG